MQSHKIANNMLLFWFIKVIGTNAKGPLYLSEYTDESFVCCFGFNKSLMRVFEPPDYRYVRRSIKTEKFILYADKHEFCITIVMVRQLIFSDLVLIFDAVFKNSHAIIYQYICIVHRLFLFLYTVRKWILYSIGFKT